MRDLVFPLLIGAFVLVACDTSKDSTAAAEPVHQGPERSGKVIYETYCASCHGASAQDFVNRDWIQGNSWMEVFASIRDGLPEYGMEGYGEAIQWGEMTNITQFVMEAQEQLEYNAYARAAVDLSAVHKTEELSFRIETVAEDVETPWGIAFLPDGDLLVTERSGRLQRVKHDGSKVEIQGIPQVVDRGQAGLFDVVLDPDYGINGRIYLSYAKPSEVQRATSTTAVVSGRIERNQWVDEQTVFEAQPYVGTFHHYGGRIRFDDEGALWITVGERGHRDDFPQVLDNDMGKVHRVLSNGQPHPGNPFFGEADKRQTIVSYGHRNPQGLFIHPETQATWVHEHGPRGGDELNKVKDAANYGWPRITYGTNYNGSIITNETQWRGMEQPNHCWVPSIAPCGMDYISSDRYPGWKGNVLVGSLAFEYVERLRMEGDSVVHRESLLPGIGRLREVIQGPDGLVYLAVEELDAVIRLVPEP